MARYEVILANNEKIVIDHSATVLTELLAEIEGKELLLVKEILGATAGAARDIIVASHQITIVRPLSEHTTQGSNFRPKR